MAKQNTKDQKANARTGKSESTPKNGKNKGYWRTPKGKKNSSSSGFKNTATAAADAVPATTADNSTLENMEVITPVSANSTLVFPTDSAAMTSFGNYITTAGQENFIENFNQVHNYPTSIVQMNIAAEATAKRTPNAMRLDIVPLFGATENYTHSWMNPIRLAALNLKQYIDTSFGTNTRYDPQDLMIYLMGCSAIYPLIAELKRDLRLAVTFQQNVYPQFVPRGLYKLLTIGDENHNVANGAGLMYTSRNLRSLIDQLNQVINMFNALPMPPEIAMFGYNDDFFDAIYTDTEDIQTAQFYVFRNKMAWRYASEGTERGACVYPIPCGEGRTIEERISLLYQFVIQLTALRTSDTAMLQNLFNAYGSKNTIHLELMDFSSLAPVEFRFDPNMLTTIENANICIPEEVEYSPYVADAEDNSVHGTMFIRQNGDQTHCAPMFNLPLQFHKPYEQITKEDIGYALRLHPAFLNHETVTMYTSLNTEETITAITSSAFTGFASLAGVTVAMIQDSGDISLHSLSGRAVHSGWEMAMFTDFKAAPIQVDYRHEGDWSTTETLTLNYYTAARDVEVTYRLEDMAMHWVYLTQTVWAANVNRNVTGSRG